MASSSNVEKFQSPRKTFCGVDLEWGASTFVVACEDDVILKSENGLLDSNRLKAAKFEVSQVHSLLGRKFCDPKLQYELRYSPFSVTEDRDGFPLVHMPSGGTDIVGNPTQILKQALMNLNDKNVSDCCIGIPVHFTYRQRKEFHAAASMPCLVPRRLLHETTAAALAYRFSETDLPRAGELFNMAFVDVSYTSMQVSVVELKRDQLKVLSHAHDESIGERAFFQVIVDHVSAKFKLDANQMTLSSMSRLQLADKHNSLPHLFVSCVDSVGVLCAKTEAELTYDTEKIVLKREEFEKLSSGLLVKVREVLRKALNEAGLAAVDVHSVQALGDLSKMPAIVNIIKNVLKKKPKIFRQNTPVATGCMIECAMLCSSSNFRNFRKFQIIDILPYSIGLSWGSENESTVEQLVLFRKGSPFPNVQIVTLQRSGVFSLDLISIDADDSQGSSKISTYLFPASPDNSLIEVKVKVELDVHGLACIKSAEVNGYSELVIEYPWDERQTTMRDKVEKAEKELEDVSMQLKNMSNEETNRRIEVEKRLEEDTSERRKLHDSKVTIERQFEELKGFLETTRNQKEQLQIQRDNAVKDNELSRMKVEKRLEEETSERRKLHDSKVTLERQFEELKGFLETTRNQKEQLQIQRDNAVKDNELSRMKVEKRLEEETSERRKLHDSKVTLERQFEELKGLLETTRNQKEQLQIQRDNAVKDNELSRMKVEKRLEEETSERRKLHDSKVTLERQFEELKGLLETTRNQKEQLQIQRDNAVKDNELSRMKVGNFTEFTRAELEEVTNNFDNSCKIGEGGFVSVYKAFLRYTNVAIKMLKSDNSQEDIEFNQEMEILTKVRHPNLVSLIGANPESRALIFEFVPNGSLDTFLTKEKNSRGKLSWQDRIRVASEICSALIFLHSVPPYGIAHGDLKPQNILLDSNLISKLADFGISRKLYKTNDTSTPLHQTQIPKFTPAYCAPEFFSSSELTPRCDIYSFGIILLQLVTGRDAQAIKYFVEEALKRGNFDKEVDNSAGNWPIQEAKKLASLGLWCSHPLAYERPDLAKDVWPSIESMKHVASLHDHSGGYDLARRAMKIPNLCCFNFFF